MNYPRWLDGRRNFSSAVRVLRRQQPALAPHGPRLQTFVLIRPHPVPWIEWRNFLFKSTSEWASVTLSPILPESIGSVNKKKKSNCIKYLTKDVVNLIKYWLELFCNITEFVRSLAKIFEQFINIEQMFLFTALFIIEGDKFSSHDSWLPCIAYLPTILDIFHFYGRVFCYLNYKQLCG